MAPSPLRFRRALYLSSSLLHRHLSLPLRSTPLLHHLITQTPKTPSPRFFTSTTISLSSRPRSFANSNGNNDDEIGPDTILFEGCDYNHWLIVVDFPKDNKPSSAEMVKFYEETASKVFGSLEEAKKKIYACSTTTYTGFQVECSEEISEKFSNLPGVIFVLPDSYIDPANKEYGGDKYINGDIIPRPPPIQYGRSGPRREFRSRPSPRGPMEGENRNYGPPVTPQNPPQQNYGPPQQQNYGPPQQNFGPPRQNYGPPVQQNYGPPQQQNYGPPRQNHGLPQQNYGPPQQPNIGPPPLQNNGLPPQQSYGQPQQQNYGPPRQNHGSAPQQNYGPPQQPNYGPPPQQNNFPPPQKNFAPPGEVRVPVPPSNVSTGWDNPQNGIGDRMPSSQMHSNQGEHRNFYPHGQRDQRNHEIPESRDFPGLPSQGGNIEQASPIAQGQGVNAAYNQNYQRQY